MININSMDIHELGLRKFYLETELVQEEFHYNSIPKRKNLTSSKLKWLILFLIPVTLTLLFSIFSLIIAADEFTFIAAYVFGGISILLSIILWSQFFKYINLLYGKKNKTDNFGAKNYEDEKKQSEQLITNLKKELYIVTERYKEAINQNKIKEASIDEDLFRYALGTYGENESDINIKLSNGGYLREKEKLTIEIEKIEKDIKYLGFKKAHIYEEYEEAKGYMYIAIFMEVILILLIDVISTMFLISIGICIIGIVLSLINMFVLYIKCNDPYINYNIEYNPKKYSFIKDRKDYKTTEERKKLLEEKLNEKNKRLDYVNRILIYQKTPH